MSNRSKRGTGSRRTRKPLVATAAAIGGAGLILGAPAAALMAAPGAQAAPVVPAPQQLSRVLGLDFFGTGGLSAAFLDPIFEIATIIPFFNHLRHQWR